MVQRGPRRLAVPAAGAAHEAQQVKLGKPQPPAASATAATLSAQQPPGAPLPEVHPTATGTRSPLSKPPPAYLCARPPSLQLLGFKRAGEGAGQPFASPRAKVSLQHRLGQPPVPFYLSAAEAGPSTAQPLPPRGPITTSSLPGGSLLGDIMAEASPPQQSSSCNASEGAGGARMDCSL